MKTIPTKMLLLNILILSTVISVTSNSWLGVWMGLEINLMSFIPMISNQNNYDTSSIKYFITQTIASITLMMSFITMLMNQFSQYMEIIIMMMNMSILMKMGAAPLHFWFPEVMENMSWNNCIILMTWQKIAPMIALSYTKMNQTFLFMFIVMSAFIGAIMGMNQISLRMIMAYSSINHMGWMLSSLQTSLLTWSWYFIIYSLLTTIISMSFKSNNINLINEMFTNKNNQKIFKLNMMISVMSLGGLPPLLGFLPKWMLIQELMQKSMYFNTMMLIMSSIITLYFYMKMFMSASLLMSKEIKWYNFNYKSNKTDMISTFMNMLSTMGLLISMLTLN